MKNISIYNIILFVLLLFISFYFVKPFVFQSDELDPITDPNCYYDSISIVKNRDTLYFPNTFGFNYSPHFVFFFYPFHYISINSNFCSRKFFIAQIQFVKYISYILSIIFFLKLFENRLNTKLVLIFFIFGLRSFPYIDDFYTGNIDSILTLFFITYIYYLKKNHILLSCIIIFFLISAKIQYFVFIPLFLLFIPDFNKFIKFILGFLILYLLSFGIFSILFSYKYYYEWITFLRPFKEFVYSINSLFLNVSIHSVALRLNFITREQIFLLNLFLITIVSLFLLILFRNKKSLEIKVFLIPFFINLLLPLVWVHYYTTYLFMFYLLFHFCYIKKYYFTYFILLILFFFYYFSLSESKYLLYYYGIVNLLPAFLRTKVIYLIYQTPYFLIHFSFIFVVLYLFYIKDISTNKRYLIAEEEKSNILNKGIADRVFLGKKQDVF